MVEIDVRMSRARSQLIQEHPFFGSLAMRLVVQESLQFETMATDGKFLFYCKKFLDVLTSAEILFVVAHEVLHCALGHHTRRNARCHKLWNEACDYVVNCLLVKAGFTLPKQGLFNPNFDSFTVEEIYAVLEKQQTQQNQQDKGDNQCQPGSESQETQAQDIEKSTSEAKNGASHTFQGTNAQDGYSSLQQSVGGDPSDSAAGTSTPQGTDPGQCGEVLDAAPTHDVAALAEAADEWQVYTRQAANVARRQGEGKAPSFVEQVIQVLNTPVMDWRSILRQFVDPVSNTKDYTWTKPNMRYVPLGMFTPGTVSDGINKVAIVIDTSGSIDHNWLQKFGCEAQFSLDEGAVDEIVLLFVDTKVHKVSRYTQGEIIDFTVQGRGGTAFTPAFDWLNQNEPDVSAVIYFTDGECTDFGNMPSFPVLWMLYGPTLDSIKFWMSRIPWGERIALY